MPESSHSLSLAEATAQMTAPGQLFEMENVEIAGIDTRVWKLAPPTMRAILDNSALFGDRDFIVYEDERISYARHHTLAATAAGRLRELGVKKGDRVAIAMRNLPEWIIGFWGAIALGAVVVPLNAWWTTEELVYGLEDSGSTVCLLDIERLGKLRPVLNSLTTLSTIIVASEDRGVAIELGDVPSGTLALSWDDFLGVVPDHAALPEVDLAPDDDATIFYTSGTTGKPKGAVGTHRNSVSNVMNLFFFSSRSTLRFNWGSSGTGESTQNANLLSVPLFHATGCHAILVTSTASGGKLVIMHHFDPERTLELIERERITIFGGVPAMVMQVLDSPDLAKRDVSSVKSVSSGGAPAPPELVRRIRDAFPIGQPGNGYGMTETSAASAMNSGPDYVEHPDSVGLVAPVGDVAVVPEDFEGVEPDPDRPQGPDVTGELWIKGPMVVRGYWHKPEATAATFTKGWVHTGDIARIDDEGFIYIVDRAKDVIIRGGENSYSVEVEAALFEHPAVADCAVIGVPEKIMGEEVGVVVVLRPGMSASAEDLARHVGERLASYNIPKHYYFWSEPLPRNPAGKILKRQLRDEVVTR